MNLHPVALQCRHQRLNLGSIAGKGIPEQERHGTGNHQQYKATQLAGTVTSLIIQVNQCGDYGKQHKHFVEVADRHMPDVRADQVGLAPAYQQTGDAHGGRGPGHGACHLAGKFRLCEQGTEIANSCHHVECAHPHNGRLTGEHKFQKEIRLAVGQHAAIAPQRKQRQCRHAHTQHAHRFP